MNSSRRALWTGARRAGILRPGEGRLDRPSATGTACQSLMAGGLALKV
ncbi:hypothetical protein [Streptomyces scopuliridis]